MNKYELGIILFIILMIVVAAYLHYRIAVSDLPFWVKYWLLK